MKIYLACEADSRQQAALTKVGYKHRLLSYFYLRQQTVKALEIIWKL